MIYTINYSNERFRRAQKLNTKTAYKQGADKVFSFSPKDIDKDFWMDNKMILSSRRGNGYWLWKPYFIKKVLDTMQEGDCLVYSDAGLFYLNNIPAFFNEMREKDHWLMCQGTGYLERQYTKRDAFVYMGLYTPEYSDTEQRAGTVALIKCEKAVKLVDEWLGYACDARIITDMPNVCGKQNYRGFIEHRHDQSIFSLLTKKYQVSQGILFEDFEFRKFSKALLCYHHSEYGKVMSIAFHRRYDPVWWELKRIIKKLIKYHE